MLNSYAPFASRQVIDEMTKLVEMSVKANSAAMVTISSRMMMLTNPVMMMYPSSQREASMMVAEKVEAVFDGAVAAATASMKLAYDSTKVGFTASEAMAGGISVMSAGLRPAARKVARNAQRLTGR